MLLDIAPSEFLVIAGAAIIFIGPKDMPRALRLAGRWFAKMRRVSNHFRAGIENMIREAEMEELQKEWAARNAAIVAAHPAIPEADAFAGAMSGTHLGTPLGHAVMPEHAGAKPPAAPAAPAETDTLPAPAHAAPVPPTSTASSTPSPGAAL